MQKTLGTSLGKLVKLATNFRPHGGHALPGLVVEKVFPGYFAKMLDQLTDGVVIVTGTNGKTTTTKMLVELLEANNVKVLTNPTGSNMTRGIISSLARQANWLGHLPYDMAVFEIDEAYAKQFVTQVKPRWVLALNVSRDQLDRFGEVDTVAKLVGITMQAATEGVITNANDPRLYKISQELASKGVEIGYFGVAKSLEKFFPNDSELVSVGKQTAAILGDPLAKPDIELTGFEAQTASYKIDGNVYQTNLRVTGQHNFQNAAAALAIARRLLPDVADKTLCQQLSNVGIAFGRGQIYTLKDGSQLQLVLVKNPASFRQTLASYLDEDSSLMIAINDNYADSRDVSWLWDADFSSLKNKVNITSGSRAADMALRLSYDNIKVDNIEASLDKALKDITCLPGQKVVIATYTAMLHIYEKLEKQAGAEL